MDEEGTLDMAELLERVGARVKDTIDDKMMVEQRATWAVDKALGMLEVVNDSEGSLSLENFEGRLQHMSQSIHQVAFGRPLRDESTTAH